MTDAAYPAATPRHDDGVDPAVRQFHVAVTAGFARYPDFAALPLADRRRIAEEVRQPWRSGGPKMHSVVEQKIGDTQTRIRIYRPGGEAVLPGLLYLHGGGWTMFSLDTHDRLMREYAARAGVAVIGIDYSLSPEAKFPRALDETLAIVRWLRVHGAAQGLDPGRLAIGGDSAGANLSVAANLRLRDAREPVLAAMLLNYGAFDSRPTSSYARYDGPDYMLTVLEMNDFWRNYTRSAADHGDPYVCPILADLTGLPAAFMAIAECDILVDANRAMAAALRSAGVAVEDVVYYGATHSFLEAMSIAPLAQRALADASRWLGEVLGGAPQES